MPCAAPPAPPNTPKSCRTDKGPNRDAPAAAGAEQTVLTDRQSSSSRQHCSGRQPAGSPLAGPGSHFGPQLQPAGARKALGVGLDRGDE